MQHTFDTPTKIELYVELGKGRLAVTAADTTQTRVDVVGKDAEDVVVEHRGDQVTVIAPRSQTGFLTGREPSYEVTVTMPEHGTLTSKTGSADVVVAGPLASAWLTTGSGDLQVELVESACEIQSGSGDIQVTDVRGDGRIKSGSGDIRIDSAGGALAVSTGSGDVQVRNVAGRLAVKTGSGDVQVGESSDDVAFSTGSGDLQVGLARRGSFVIKGASGDVRIGVPSGTPVWTDISTVTGRIRSDLEPVGAPAEGQDHLEIRAKTASGDITLQQR
ncbi:hypothetical protein DDE18_01475 [Nocardioides gansuensis]|uniref:DUF4097 domain-containing protein n=1 Tax=Nocardioides gansuensis TaxID=2138300 RepID=A0A2T8FF35_9ACTN|nr:DUF4097 family beta strand repeat-containing protein [Nocardioides gansuensis]PVG84324.1 hypothetical protein DDE18_01475 [Nocardioides gansuensis]